MFELFLKAIEKILELLEHKKIGKEDVLNKIIEPLFINLQIVVDDYFKLFYTARNLMDEKSKKSLKEAQSIVKKNRELLLTTRIQVREMAQSFKENINDKKVNAFLTHIYNFFYSTTIENNIDIEKSRSANLIDLFDYVMEENITMNKLNTYIDESLINLEKHLIAIAQAYASIRVYYLSSIWNRNVLKKEKGNK